LLFPAFDGSQRQVRLLRFLVDEVLAGRGGALRAPLVATRVFERPEGFDSTEDSIVRVEMSKLRRALDRHNALTDAAAMRIELPRGSYAPVFVAAPQGPLSTRDPRSGPMPAVRADGPVLAVLPFAALTAISTDGHPTPPQRLASDILPRA
jgi:hypothetical protein